MPHLEKMMEEFKDAPVSFISVNTRNPKGQVKSEIRRYNMKQPIHYGRGQHINKNFKVRMLPRLIFINPDSTIHKDVIFMNEEDLRAEIQMLLENYGGESKEPLNTDAKNTEPTTNQ